MFTPDKCLQDMMADLAIKNTIQTIKRLEEEATSMLNLGYTINRLTIVQWEDGWQEIHAINPYNSYIRRTTNPPPL